MKKPDSAAAMLRYIAVCLGAAFLLMGALCVCGVMQASVASEVQDSHVLGLIFLAVGAAFAVLGVLLHGHVRKADALYADLLANGRQIEGTVVKVSHGRWMQFGHDSPCRVQYCFTCDGREVRRKSCFLWEQPEVSPGDPITVYVNDGGASTVKL